MPLTRSLWLAEPVADLGATTTAALLEAAVAAAPDAVALVDGAPHGDRRRWTHRELWEAVRGAAQQLLVAHTPGERIAVWGSNRPEWEIVELGAHLAGLVVVTINPALSPREAEHVLRSSGATGLVVERTYRGTDLLARALELQPGLPALRLVQPLDAFGTATADDGLVLPHVRPEDPAMVLYTSGTTGFPKGAELSHAGLTSNATLFARRFGLRAGSVWVNPMPMFHLGGCSFGALGALSCGGVHVVHDFDAAHTLRLVEQERATFLPIVPTMAVSLMDHPSFATTDVSSVELLAGGSTTIPPSLVHRIEQEFGADFEAIFGQTECAGVICQSVLDDATEDKASRVGRPLDGTDLKVTAPGTDEPLPVGEVGELCVRSSGTFVAYVGQPEETARTKDAEGWVRTGDLGTIDERGYVAVTGRLKDMIVRGGENVYAREIEDLLLELEGIEAVAVVGLPDDYWGEQVAAFVRPRAEAALDPEVLTAWLRERMVSSKVPRYWVRVDEMPVTTSGKIQKHRLREGFAERAYEVLAAPTLRAQPWAAWKKATVPTVRPPST